MKIGQSPSRHLNASELFDATAACPVCGSAAPRQRVFLVQADPDVHLLECSRCRACSTSYMPTPEVLVKYYREFYLFRAKEHAVTFAGPDRFANHVLRRLPKSAFGDAVRILDFGGGDGTLSTTFAKILLRKRPERRVTITLVDFSEAAPIADSRIVLTHQHPDLPIEETFDLVLASGVLEHIPAVQPKIDALYSALAPGGFFYARTPYMMPFTQIFRRLDITFPNHVHDMGSPFWNRFTATFGWDARVLRTGTSVIESTLRGDFWRTLAAIILKLPAHVEGWFSPVSRVRRLWHLVAGWEVILQRRG